ncbi:TetR/AcrR family transcriptional regulator [Streptomyces minutiscleroticus]|uniref:TetR/AcrR family transcriptional regulator n=1 Tax=Streptomyces minutiscleroticus TaxID=68238 RepID=UPI001E2F3986|nr:TetR/AcrR family transcriptional regulator [Streptomyces minutiscleroticus]
MTNRDRLLESTRALLWERGYIGASPAAIQQRAKVGQGSMYHHFDGKRGLAVEALTTTAQDIRLRAEAALDRPGPALDRVVAYLRVEREALRGCPVGRMAFDPDVVADDALRGPVEGYFSWLTERLRQLLEEARTAEQIAPHLAPADVSVAVVATIQGGYVLARALQDPSAMSAALDGVIALLTGGKG